jgi:hypothetical protein
VTVNVSDWPPNVATTERAWLIVSVQVPVPEQSPDQPEKLEPLAGVAVSVTLVVSAKACEQVEPQSIPAGLDVTVPVQTPALPTLRSPVRAGKTPTHG